MSANVVKADATSVSSLSSFAEIKSIKKESLKKLSKNWKKAYFIVALKLFFTAANFVLSIFMFFLTNSNHFIFSYIFPNFFVYAYAIIQNYSVFLFIVTQILMLFLSLFLIPLNFGIFRWFNTLTQTSSAKISEIFFYYRNIKLIFKTFLFKFVMWFKIAIFSVIFLIPGVVLFIFSCIKMQIVSENKKWLFSLAVLGSIVFLLCGIIFFIKFASKYFLLPYLQVINDENFAINTKKSLKIVDNNEEYMGKIFVSFCLWLPLQIFIIPMFFVFPYTTEIMFVAINKKI